MNLKRDLKLVLSRQLRKRCRFWVVKLQQILEKFSFLTISRNEMFNNSTDSRINGLSGNQYIAQYIDSNSDQ